MVNGLGVSVSLPPAMNSYTSCTKVKCSFQYKLAGRCVGWRGPSKLIELKNAYEMLPVSPLDWRLTPFTLALFARYSL